MKPTSTTFLFLFLLLLFSFQSSANGQYIVAVSSLTENSTMHSVQGVSSTQMDYYTQAYYYTLVVGYIYNQDPNVRLDTKSAESGSNGIAAVTTQVTNTPSWTLYNLRSEHYFYPIYPSCTFPGSCNKYDYYGYLSRTPQYTGVTQYGASQTFLGANNFLTYSAPNYIFLGNTNTSIRSAPTLSITNQRVSGNLVGTSQNALLGSPADFEASVTPTGLGGNYVWAFSGPYVQEFSLPDNSYRDIYWTEPGTYTATVTYSGTGYSVSGTVTVQVRVPTLTHFAGTSSGNTVDRGRNCSRMFNSYPFGASYSLGCSQNNPAGMLWSATASIPDVPYLNSLNDAGIQFKQIVSVLRKRLNNGRHECFTARTNPSDTSTGWQLDGAEIFSSGAYFNPTFLAGKTITAHEFDSPASPLDRNNADGPPFQREAVMVDDYFETYVQYYTGSPGAPDFVRTLHIADAACPANRFDCGVDRLVWKWAGEVHYDSAIPGTFYRETAATTTVGNVSATRAAAVRSYSSTLAQHNVYALCPGALNTTNPIDGSRFFVQKLYVDVLNRLPDQSGWDAWTSVITSCGFDTVCTNNTRIHVARGFLESPENFANNPALANPGSHTYNREYVRLCYTSFLDRDPDAPGWDGWTNFLDTHPGEYSHLVGGFINSTEYRNRWAIRSK